MYRRLIKKNITFLNKNNLRHNGSDVFYLCCFISGARTDIKNNELKMAYDLAKDAQTAGILQHAGMADAGSVNYNHFIILLAA